jgi:hypothetical protein
MLFEIDDKIISTEIFTKKFVCDLNACKGACCVVGDGGAPLVATEIENISTHFSKITPYMRAEGLVAIEENGIHYVDKDGDPVTTLVNNQECAFVFFDEENIAKCSIEHAYNKGEIDFNKPLSCHLYPIRTKKIGEYIAVNYEEWDICKAACACGEKLNVPVYKFLKGPLIRAFGADFFDELVAIEKELELD